MFDLKTFRAISTAAAIAMLVLGCSQTSNREDFATQLRNKTQEEVLRYAGKPDEVDESASDHVSWIYKARTFDVVTRKNDLETIVIFTPSSDGKLHVSGVEFE